MFNQLPINAIYKSGELEGNYKDIVFKLGKVSLNKDYYFTRWLANPRKIENKTNNIIASNGYLSKDTIFNEVKSCTNKLSRDIINISKLSIDRISEEKSYIAKILVNKLLDSLYNSICMIRKPIIVSHSSGYDSRIISLLLRELAIKEDVFFICHQPEIELFRKIIKLESCWDDKNIITIKENDDPVDYNKESVDFNILGSWIFELNKSLYEEYYIRKEIEKLGNDVLILSGVHGNQLWLNDFSSIGFLLARQFYNLHYQYENDYEIYYPFMDAELLKMAINFNFKSNMAYEVSKILDYSVAEVPNYTIKNIIDDNDRISGSYHKLSNSTRNKMLKDFRSSWLYKNWDKLHGFNHVPETCVFIPKTRNSYTAQFFMYYSMASVCEYFIKQGVEIEI